MRECSLIYKPSGLNLPSQWPHLRYTMFTVLSSRREWISKFKKSDKLTCTESLMIKLSTAILLLVEVEPSVWSVFLVLLVPYFDLYLSVMLEFCRYVRVWRSKRNKKTCFKTLDKGRQWKHFISRVQGLPLASDSVHDKHDAQFVSYFTYILSRSVIKLLFACNAFSARP